MAGYQQARDKQALPMFDFTCQLAAFEPPPPDMQRLLGAVHGNREAMDAFAGVIAGTVAVSEFFRAENIERIMAAAGAVPAS